MAYKNFANGFPLPASDLQNFLMNQSVIVFVDSTARAAAIPTPTEGMVIYLEDVDSLELWTGAAWQIVNDNSASIPKSTVTTAGDLIVADGASSVTRLGVGADDQVLTLASGLPVWADAGGGGAKNWTVLSTANFPSYGSGGTAASTISGLSGYDNYLVQINLARPWNSGTTAYLQFDTTNSSNYSYIKSDGTSAWGTSADQFPVSTVDYTSGELKLLATISGASSGGVIEVNFISDGNGATWSGGGFINLGGTPLDEITIALSVGSFQSFTGCTILGA